MKKAGLGLKGTHIISSNINQKLFLRQKKKHASESKHIHMQMC